MSGEHEQAVRPLAERTTEFAVRVIRLVESLPYRSVASQVIGRQLLRSATSVGANYRAAKRSRSPAEFIAKLGICEEEADECVYWIELLCSAQIVKRDLVESLLQESNELLAIIIASIRTAKRKTNKDHR